MRIGVFVIDHKPRIEDTAVDDTTLLELVNDGHDDLILDHRKLVARNHGSRRIRAHATGVRALVAVENPLMVLRTRQQHSVIAVHHREN